jgi:hypothetical protein
MGYDHLVWMKLSEIARYWAARELTRVERQGAARLGFHAPFACPQFTVKFELDAETGAASNRVLLRAGQNQAMLTPVASLLLLKSGTMFRHEGGMVACVDLPKGSSRLELERE